ncbi:hypothetical protein K439DRAFT_1660249 [Ramaria rubella]|nr:hypothetical protein K439DRAFT_1660249 [Ramaria rubella]
MRHSLSKDYNIRRSTWFLGLESNDQKLARRSRNIHPVGFLKFICCHRIFPQVIVEHGKAFELLFEIWVKIAHNMADIIMQDRTQETDLNPFESQALRSSQLPIAPEERSVMYDEGTTAGSDSVGESSATRTRTENQPTPNSARVNQSRSEQARYNGRLSCLADGGDDSSLSSNRRHASGRSSLPVTSIGHLVSSEPSSREPPINEGRILCKLCNEWIVTRDAEGNTTSNWAEHFSNCLARATRDASHSPMEDVATSISVTPAPTADSSEPKDTNTAFRRRKVKHYESERLALLEKDPQVEDIEEYRVLCAFCEKWIQLRKDRPYCPNAWTAHKLQCVNRRRKPGPKPGPGLKKVKREPTATSGVPSEVSQGAVQVRRTEEERINFLKSDPHATTVEPHRILCAICGRWIQLRKNSTYCTAPWEQHVKKCAARHDTPRKTNGSAIAATGTPNQEEEDELESEDDVPRTEFMPEEVPQKRGRGRPRKRKFGQAKPGQPASFALRPVSATSPTPSNARAKDRSVSPPMLRTPSPLLNHPYSNDLYWYPTLPPMSSYYPLYAGSQYNENDDSYSLYFHAQPPAHQVGPTPGQGRFRAKPPKQMFLNPGNTPNPTVWQSPSPMPLPTGSATVTTSTSPGPDGTSPQPGRAWIVWRLKNYSTNSCPMDPAPPMDTHSSSTQRAGSEVSGSGSEALPMFRSGTWPHLLDPQEPTHTQNLSPYVHPATPGGSNNGTKDIPSAPGTRSAHFGLSSALTPAPPPPEDPGLISFNSSAHIPIRTSESFHPHSHSHPHLHSHPPHQAMSHQSPIHHSPSHQASPHQVLLHHAQPHHASPPLSHTAPPDPNIDPRFAGGARPLGPAVPNPPQGADLDSPEYRLAYTFRSIAYLFNTSFQGADDMSLDTLTSFMNRSVPREKMYDGQEVSQHVAILGERKQLVFTKEGGVQLLAPPP